MAKKKMTIALFFACPVMSVKLDLDLEKLTEFAFEMWNKDKKGIQHKTNKGGWHSNNISEEKHEEFEKLKKEINQYLQIYHLEIFRGMKFKEKVTQDIDNMCVNINEKHNYNEWHIHPHSILSGAYYIKHDGSKENGELLLKHPNHPYMSSSHWPQHIMKKTNEVTSGIIHVTPASNSLFIFPSWLEHKVGNNLKTNSRISVSFNSSPILEKKS